MEETQRQKRINSLIQRELATIIQHTLKMSGLNATFVSVTKVSITIDLTIARVYLSIFPIENRNAILKEIAENKTLFKHKLAVSIKQLLRKTPDLEFFKDDTLDYVDAIDRSLKGRDNPIEDRSLLSKRKLI